MSTPNNKKAGLSKWLDSLQQESWQLELIISGVVIFLMLGAHETIQGLNDRVMVDILTGNELLMLVASAYAILSIAYYALLLTFLLHLILRGLWIGAIGLRSVSGDFEYEVLDYQPRFTNWLQKRMGAFDDYIERLEMQCSLAFSFAFLMFFSVISIGTFIITIAAVTIGTGWLVGLSNTQDPATWQILTTAGANLFMAFIGLIYLIDFSSLGWFKKKKILQKVYFPFYRFMGWVTFARFYRPFYYNLIDHPFGRKLVKRMWIVVLGALIIISISIIRYDYFPTENKGQSIIHPGFYHDTGETRGADLGLPGIASRYAERDYLEIFIPYSPTSDDRMIDHLFPSLGKAHTSAFAIDGLIKLWNSQNAEVDNDSLLMAHRAIHRLYLDDSLLVDASWQFYTHPERDQPGLRYDLPVYDLPRGEHLLRFDEYVLTPNDSTYWNTKTTISFLK